MCDTPYIKRLTEPAFSIDGFIDVMEVPCGRCRPCRLRMSYEWIFRCQQELKTATSAYFITLTYDDEHLPFTANGYPTLDKEEVKKYWKRVKKRHNSKKELRGSPNEILHKLEYGNEKKKIKYICVGEYGGVTRRPHYHAIVFNANKQDLTEAWSEYKGNNERNVAIFEPLGHVFIPSEEGQVNGASIMYVLNYLSKVDKKKIYEEIGGDKLTGITGRWKRPAFNNEDWDGEDEFRLVSNGIGEDFLKGNLRPYKEGLDTVALEDGKLIPIPSYYVKNMFDERQRKDRAYRLQKTYRMDLEEWRKQHENPDEMLASKKRFNHIRKNTLSKKVRL